MKDIPIKPTYTMLFCKFILKYLSRLLSECSHDRQKGGGFGSGQPSF